jgi:hypothetical protein
LGLGCYLHTYVWSLLIGLYRCHWWHPCVGMGAQTHAGAIQG